MTHEIAARLADLATAFALPPAAPPALARLLALVAEDRSAPTSAREPAAGIDVHVADSLTGLLLEPVRSATAIADLGAGAGFPGLVLAAALPEARVALVEATGRKCAFLEQAIAAADLPNARVVCARAEEWTAGLEAHDLVTARALAPLAVLAEYAAPLLRIGGALVAWKGARDADEEAAGAAAATELGLEAGPITRVSAHVRADARHLHLYLKVRATPPRFPRRAGMARKRPLGGSRRR